MEIPKEKLEEWNSLLEHGDQSKISRNIKLDKATLSRVFSGDIKNVKTIHIAGIKRYFEEKKKDIAYINNNE